MIEIKNSDGTLLHTVEAANLRGADLYGANLYGADLRRANLRGADLYGADLYGANLRGANLRGADLRGADLRGANLRGANLRGANLYGANLRGANLRGAKCNWQSHTLIAEILQQSAGDSVARRSLAGLILISTDWCWDQFLEVDHPEREWALGVLRACVTPDDDAPEVLKGGSK